MRSRELRIGTRGSQLALYQANWVKDRLTQAHPGLQVSLVKIKTTGDKILDAPLAKVGGKGLFVKEIEDALLEKRIDLAVHSIKDVTTEFPEGLHLSAITKREDPRDVFISKDGTLLMDLRRAGKDWNEQPETSGPDPSSEKRLRDDPPPGERQHPSEETGNHGPRRDHSRPCRRKKTWL